MKVDSQTHGAVLVLIPRGPLAADELADFKRSAETAIQQKTGRVVIDCHDVPYLDSEGIEALLELCGERRANPQRPKLAHVGETCREALNLTSVLARLDVFDTVENAIRSYKR